MNAPGAALTMKKAHALFAIVWGGFVCAVLDIAAALVVYGYFGLKPLPLLQGIASGLLGPRSFSGGIGTALLGLLCHFVIAFSAAAAYVTASRLLPFLVQHALLFGSLYGVA